MTIKGKRLESTTVKRVNDFLETEVRPREKLLYLVDPENIKDPIKRKNQITNNGIIIREIGPPPYVLLDIIQYPILGITFNIEGEKGIKEKVSKYYFNAY